MRASAEESGTVVRQMPNGRQQPCMKRRTLRLILGKDLREKSWSCWHTTCSRICQLGISVYASKGAVHMLSRCANEQCCKPFLRLRDGKLFLVETERLTKPGQPVAPPFVRARQQQRQVEHYWLCDECATKWSLVYDRERGVALAPLRKPIATATAAAARSGIA